MRAIGSLLSCTLIDESLLVYSKQLLVNGTKTDCGHHAKSTCHEILCEGFGQEFRDKDEKDRILVYSTGVDGFGPT